MMISFYYLEPCAFSLPLSARKPILITKLLIIDNRYLRETKVYFFDWTLVPDGAKRLENMVG